MSAQTKLTLSTILLSIVLASALVLAIAGSGAQHHTLTPVTVRDAPAAPSPAPATAASTDDPSFDAGIAIVAKPATDLPLRVLALDAIGAQIDTERYLAHRQAIAPGTRDGHEVALRATAEELVRRYNQAAEGMCNDDTQTVIVYTQKLRYTFPCVLR